MMNERTRKGMVYTRTISALMAVYLIFMLCFSVFFIFWQEKAFNYAMGSSASYENAIIQKTVQNCIDDGNQLIDLKKAKKNLAGHASHFEAMPAEVAIYSADQDLLYRTGSGWPCSYTEREKGDISYIGYAILDPSAWLSKAETDEITAFYDAQPKGKEIGDLQMYHLEVAEFWLDNEIIIPNKIIVYANYATEFNAQGEVERSDSRLLKEYPCHPSEERIKDLPYFKYAFIQHDERRNMRSEALQQGILQHKDQLFQRLHTEARNSFIEKAGLLTKRVYVIFPYQNSIYMQEEEGESVAYSPIWTVMAWESNALKEGWKTLLFVWLGCFLVFGGVAAILAESIYRIEKQREEVEKHRIETANALAHDLKTPLSIISGYAQSLAENVQTEKREYYAERILNNISRMDRTIQEMLELSRLDPKVFTPQFQNISLGQVCSSVLERYRELCEEKEIQTTLTGEAIINADGLLIERVIDHFFVNAMKNICQKGERIEIAISPNQLTLHNSGSRIPEAMMEDIWQTEKKSSAARKNGGFGLSISRTILDLHQFSYGAENKGDGVTFWFAFASPAGKNAN